MSRLLRIAFAATIVGCVFGRVHADAPAGAIEVSVESVAKPWTSLDLNNNPDVFRFAVVSDNAGGPRAGIFNEAVAKLNLLQPEFVMSIGDFIEGYEDTREALNVQWDRFMAGIDQLEMPFFFVPGNHDVGRPLWLEVYKERFGTPNFHFVYKNVLFLCLNTNDGPDNSTGISDAQVAYAEKVLAEHPGVRYTLVFQHKPLWSEENSNWNRIEALLKARPCTVFSGHTHNYLSHDEDTMSFLTLATTGGGSALRGPLYGEFDQIAWVTMTKDGPRVANLLLDGILDKDFRTPDDAKSFEAFRRDKAVVATAVLFDGPQFTSGTSKLTVTNPAATDLRLKVLTEVPAGMRVEPATVTMIVPGNSSREADLRISADAPVPSTEVQPLVLHWEARYDIGGNEPSLAFDGERPVPINARHDIPLRDQAPVIDGKLDDWTALPFTMTRPADVYTNPAAWKGPQDGSLRFGVARDDQYLYVAVKTQDDEPNFDGWKYWEDFAAVLVDARASEKDDPENAVFSVFIGPKFPAEQGEEFSMGKAPDGLQAASTPADNGLEAEVAIPLSYLAERQGGDWQHVRLNIGFSDYDTRDARDGATILYWRPQWTGPRDFPESGLFVKAPDNP